MNFLQQKLNAVIIILFLFTATISFSQVIQAKEWSKDIALFRGKAFLFNDVLGGASVDVRKFSVIPLASSKSGELTTLIYKSEELKKEGLILGFFGDYWNEAGVTFQGYAFKNLPADKAKAFLNKIEKSIEDHKNFLQEDSDNNNIYFKFDDLEVLIYRDGDYVLRIFWKKFDSTWENTAFRRSKRRFLKNI
ncbi:MAG: hypothetical protein KGV59_04995 [Tenacibaculum sp.]|nr:hypothetical protein [Tenacibaculum sp.]